MPQILAEAEVASYRNNGYLAIDGLLNSEETAALVQRVRQFVDEPVDGVRIHIEPRVQRGEADARSKVELIRKIDGSVANDARFLRLAKHPQILPRL